MDSSQPAAPHRPGGAGRLPGLVARRYWLWPALLTLALGAYRIDGAALWADELATWGVVRLGWGALFRLLGNVDAVVAPYYLLVKLWTGVAGTSTAALRIPTVLAMGAATALVAVFGARLATGAPRHRRWVGLLAGVLFAVVPATTRYGQEARPYSFAILMAVLATLTLTRLLDRPGPRSASAYGAAVVGLGACHLVALLLLVAHAVAVAWRARRAPDRRRVLAAWLTAAGTALVVLSPLALLGYRQRAQISWLAPAHWHALAGTPTVLFVGDMVAGAVIVLASLAVRRRPAAALLAAWAVVPVLSLYLVAKLTPLYWPRYLLFTVPAWVLLASRTLAPLRRWRALLTVAIVAALGATAQQAIRAPDGHLHATSAAAAVIAANTAPGDGIVYALHEAPEPWEARDIVARYVPPAQRPADVFAVRPQRSAGHLLATECPDMVACLAKAQPVRLWTIRFEQRSDPLHGLGQPKEDLLRARYHLQRLWHVRGLTVALLVRD